MRLLLFGTYGCHLCEQAELIVNECLTDGPEGTLIETIDIAEQDYWHEKYALRIPVLCIPETNQELAWPFDHAGVKTFIRHPAPNAMKSANKP